MLSTRVFLAAAVLCAGLPAQAQTANDINRLNSAIQICNSPMGAGMAECARLHGQLGGGGGGALGGGSVGAAGILGSVMSASRSSAPAAPRVNSAAIQQGIAACVQNAAGNSVMIQACLTAAANAPAPPRPAYGIQNYQAAAAPAPRGPSSMLPSDRRSQDAAMATYGGAQSYQACAAANPTSWQSCLPLLNGGPAPR